MGRGGEGVLGEEPGNADYHEKLSFLIIMTRVVGQLCFLLLVFAVEAVKEGGRGGKGTEGKEGRL